MSIPILYILEAFIVPFTSDLYNGFIFPIPILPVYNMLNNGLNIFVPVCVARVLFIVQEPISFRSELFGVVEAKYLTTPL